MSSSTKTFQDAESIYDRATKLEFAAEFASAFALYLDAAEAFLQLSPAADPASQAQCKANARKAIQRAEKIKKASKTPGTQVGVASVPIDPFGADNQAYVLRKSSIINDIRYPLWSEPVPLPSDPRTLYSDPSGQPIIPPLKTAPSTVIWKSLAHDPFASQGFPDLTPTDVDQNIINDCSVCASVAVCVQHNQRFHSRLLSSSLLPGNQPAIDDSLPFDHSGRPMGISSGRKAVAWPALVEKAYMKVMGGYDFPGSNSAIDLRVLTGWIPEHIELQSTSFERERTWERIVNGFRDGYCVLTVGTDTKSTMKMEGVNLLPSHDYAVIDVRETRAERWLTLVDSRVPTTNPSLHPRQGSGSNSSASRESMLDIRWDEICATFEGIYVSWDPRLFQTGLIFHGTWKPANMSDKVQASVRHLRLLYECQISPNESDDPLDLHKDIWVLLTRHFPHSRRTEEYISLTVSPQDEDDWRDIWVKTGGTEVKGTYTTSPHVMVRTKIGFSTSSCASPSTLPPPTKISGALSVRTSYDGPFDDVFFTVNVFSGANVKAWWDINAGTGDSMSRGGFSVQVDGTLTTKNAGGNHTHPTYMLNPQWHLRIYDENTGLSVRGAFTSSGKASPLGVPVGSSKPAESGTGPKSIVVLSAQGPREVPLNVTSVWSSGERIVELAQNKVAVSSGPYTYGRARAMADMAPGDYTVILSAFEPQIHLGPFTLKVESSSQFDLEPIPQEGAGMYARISRGEWGQHTAVGGPSHGRYHLNPMYEVQLPSSAKLSARLHLTSSVSTTPLNLSLFTVSSGTPSLNRPLASSGPYSDALSGVSIPPRTLNPGRYWLVPSTFAAGVHTSFRLVVYCSDAGCVVARRTP